jgi:preprotein translocase subunit SecE
MSDPQTPPETVANPSSGNGNYFREAYEELRRVNWPTRDEIIQGTQTVLVFVIGFTLLLWVCDLAFRALSRLVF